jgi:hypothetical protein
VTSPDYINYRKNWVSLVGELGCCRPDPNYVFAEHKSVGKNREQFSTREMPLQLHRSSELNVEPWLRNAILREKTA